MSKPVKPLRSLRRTLLLWLLLPLLTLFSIGTAVVYHIALGYSEDAYDRGLLESANDVVQLSKESLRITGQVATQSEARDMILADQFDTTFLSILDEQDRLLVGDGKLKKPPHSNKNILFYDTTIDNKPIRAVTILLTMSVNGKAHRWQIIVGETRHKRDQLADDIIFIFVLPQALIILFATVLVMLGVRRGLAPLEILRAALAKRSHNDMQALEVPDLPIEVQPLTREINHLLSRLATVFEGQKHFTADAAHQLRTPLAGLAAQTDFAREQDNPEPTQHALEQIKLVSTRLNHAVNQLLSVARNEPGADKSVQLAPMDLNEFSRDATLEWVEVAVQYGIDLGFEGFAEPVLIAGDDVRLKEMLDNLIDNALRYCPKGSRVTVRVDENQTLSVEDNGNGIPPEERERIFKRFHRLLGNEAHGNGLGLAIVKEIAEIHGAEVSVSQGAGGQGALFKVSFPTLPHA
ncbi:MAG: ATP-binding protein [Methylophilaceae bacterium]